MAASRTAAAECDAAAGEHSGPALHTPAIANPSRTRRTIDVQTNRNCLRRWRSTQRTQQQAQLLLVSIGSLHSTKRHSGDEALYVARVRSTRLLKYLEERGRGFSINQVQNGGADSLSIVDLSARFVLSSFGSRPTDRCTSRVLTNMTTMSFIPKTSRGFRRSRELKCAFETLKDC